MCLHDGKRGWQLDREMRVVAYAVEVECGYLESHGVLLDRRENGWIDRCGYNDEGVGCEGSVLSDEDLERLWIAIRNGDSNEIWDSILL